MVYLDNAATTFPKPTSVISETYRCIKRYCANHGRSAHSLALKTSEKIYETREKIVSFLNFPRAENLVFSSNATNALNLAIKTTVKADSHVLISDIEHNSVFRPVYALSRRENVSYSIFDTDGDLYRNITSLITEKTSCIISTLCSNVTGKEIPFEVLSRVRDEYGLKLIIDASQIIGHKKIDLSKTGCDVLCAPSHKALFGIQGAGFALFLDDTARDTVFEGGSGNDSLNPEMPENLPERFEAGTLPAPSVISMLYGIDFIEKTGVSEVEERISSLSEKTKEILSEIKKIKIYSAENGIVSFNLSDIPSSVIAYELDGFGICTRSGLHCAPLAHKKLGTEKNGTVRVSFSLFNSEKDIEKLYKALRIINKKYS